jgi:hypothetical protein
MTCVGLLLLVVVVVLFYALIILWLASLGECPGD